MWCEVMESDLSDPRYKQSSSKYVKWQFSNPFLLMSVMEVKIFGKRSNLFVVF